MKKRIKFLVCILIAGASFAQTDELNTKKYWKFRNSFRENYIKIGSAQGESLPAGRRNPFACIDNLDYIGDKGFTYWVDGMIRQGHYIGFLATEYRLLKNHGQDVTAVLNELYYALYAINRVDRDAEQIITSLPENNMPAVKPQSLNGFYLRDDVPENFYQKWQNTKIKCRCTHGSIYENNNAAKENYGEYYAHSQTTGGSLPSLDQMTSLLVGLTVCDKLLDDGLYVQPTPSDSVMDLRNEVKQITNRIISYAYNHNWFLLDEWGWPVDNGGGELLFTAYPISLIGQNIVGNNYSSTAKRRIDDYDVAQIYYSLPTQMEKDAMWDTLSFSEKQQVNDFSDYNPWPLNVGGPSNFEEYQSDPSAEEVSIDFTTAFWQSIIPAQWPSVYEDWLDDHKFNETFGWPVSAIKFKKLNLTDYNNTILFNLGVASGLFSNSQVFEWGTTTHHYQLVLIDALLKNQTPAYGGKTFFQNLLNSMPVYGGFKFSAENWPVSTGKQLVWSPGWGGEYKWTHATESNNAIGVEGQFNALDYMYLHNLYYLVYGNDLPEYEESYGCICDGTYSALQNLPVTSGASATETTLSALISSNTPVLPQLMQKFSFLEFCMENTFADFSSNELTSTYDLIQLFDDYHQLEIALNEYQTQHFTIKNTGELNVESRLVICETKILTVQDGGVINLDKGEIRINPGAQLIIEGDVNTLPGTKIVVEGQGKIIIKNGGILNNEGYIQLKPGASLEYEEGATLRMNNNESEVHFDGGDLVIKENADFTFDISGAASGQLRFSSWGAHITAENNTSILLNGNNENDPILVLDKDADFWSNSTGLNWIGIHNGKVILHENSRLVSIQDFNSNHVHYDGLELNRGLVVFDQTVIANAIFDEVPIYAPLFYGSTGIFNLTNSEINNQTANSVVKIKGMGYNISGCTFNGSAYYLLDGQNTTQFSTITDCDFNGDLSTVGVIDNSTAEVQVSKCNFNTLYAGVHKMNGRLNLKCNTFVDFHYAAAVAHNNCILDLSSLGFGGYNSFEKNAPGNGTNIALWNAQNIYASFGYNYFDEQGNLPIIQGTLNLTAPAPPAPAKTLLFKFNRWNVANVAPVSGDFAITSSQPGSVGNTIAVMTSDYQTLACPASGTLPPDVVSIGPAGLTQSATINTLHFPQTRLYIALNTAVSESKRYNAAKDDRTAIELLEEILSYNYTNKTDATDWLIGYGYAYMRLTLQHAFSTGAITRADNSTAFHPSVVRYVNVLNRLSSERMTTANYRRLFYLEMDKAHLFHMLGKHQTALSILVNMESCGLDSAEQAHVNYWKYEMDLEYRKIAFGKGAEFIDTNWVDSSAYIHPIKRSPGIFGSEIISINSINLFNCNNPRSAILTDEKGSNFKLFPNPASDIVYISYELEENQTGEIAISSIDGKEIARFKCSTGSHFEVVGVGHLSPGTYIYSFVTSEGVTEKGKFIVER